MSEPLTHDHEVLVTVLVYHQRMDERRCGCGWGELGRSHAEHVAQVYEASLRARSVPRAGAWGGGGETPPW